MADLYVDVDALNELLRQLDEVKASLLQAKADVSQSDQRLGSSRMRGELEDFVEGWKDGRRKIIEGIDGLQGRIRMAIDAYSTQEAALSKAASGK